jgi:pimeloyl-ACP methyl ester carboxylesterase
LPIEISKIHVVGVSYGGAIALNLAARYPEKVEKIVSIEGNGINGNKNQKISYGALEDLLKYPVDNVSFEHGIHDLQLQKPEEVARLILKFLTKGRTLR